MTKIEPEPHPSDRAWRGPAHWLGGWKGAFAAALLGALAGGGLVSLWSGPLVRAAIMRDPEMIPEAMQHLRDREAAEVVNANRAALETPFAGAWTGAKGGDVVVVEFFDYACPFCRKTNADVDRLLRGDPKLKLVWREWPVLGPDSDAAAEISLAAAAQGRFRPFHDAMFETGRPTPANLETARRTAGISPLAIAQVRASPAAAQELARNYQLARALNASGTPTFVIGDRILQGAVGYDALKAAVVQARARG